MPDYNVYFTSGEKIHASEFDKKRPFIKGNIAVLSSKPYDWIPQVDKTGETTGIWKPSVEAAAASK